MDEKLILEEVTKTVDSIIEKRIGEVVGKEASSAARKVVEEMRAEKMLFGYDRTLLDDKQKCDFAKSIKSLAFPHATKAKEEIISEIDSRGGYLVPVEVANAIERVARS